MQIASRGDVCAGEVEPQQQDVPHDEPLAEDCGEHPASGNEPVPADENDGRPDIVQAASTPLDHPSPSVAIEPITIAESSFEWDKEGFRAFLVSKGFTPRTVQNRRSEEHTSELQSLMRISYAVFCLKKKNYKEH